MNELVTSVDASKELAGILDETAGAAWLAQISNPVWDNAINAHDWRCNVPPEIQEIWGLLSIEARMVAYFLALDLALRAGD